jgi:uncharacterized protein (DUF2147 family)
LPAARRSRARRVARAAGGRTPVGLWKTIDDETKQPKALIRIVEKGGVLSGRIEKILTDKADARCDLCTDDRKDKPVQGMTIITGMKPDGEQWAAARSSIRTTARSTAAKMKLLDGGESSNVRGFIGTPLLGRSQTWLREE